MNGIILKERKELSAEVMPLAMKDPDFLEKQSWEQIELNKISLEPFAIYFIKIKKELKT
ncbi:MAG: hypothetical protein HC830_14205 [Bacteroidetes bacterium]|nr:hypothetical protein [Bacteroidota bacterium]